jgi:hypothetical protein
MNQASVSPDALLLGRDANLTTHAPSFIKNKRLLACHLQGAVLDRGPY